MAEPARGGPWLAATLVLAGLFAAAPAAADDPVGSSVRYNREIVRIFDRKCLACHGPRHAIPLASYADVRPWARAIREEILHRRMPPWAAAHGIRPLANDASLTIREIAIIASWADGGVPRGDPADLPARRSARRWPAGPPSLELVLPTPEPMAEPGSRPARLHLSFGHASAWFRGFDLTGQAPGSVRAAALFLEREAGQGEWLASWTPWHAMATMPAGCGSRLPHGSRLRLELQLDAAGAGPAALGDARLGLYLDAGPPTSVTRTLAIEARPEPGRADGRRRGALTLSEATRIWAFQPWLADAGVPAGGSLEVTALRGDGSVEALLWLPAVRPEWPSPYVLREPARLPAGTRLVVSAFPQAGSAEPSAGVWLRTDAEPPAEPGYSAVAKASTVKKTVDTAPPRWNWVQIR